MILRDYKKEDGAVIAGWLRSEEELYKWSADRFNKYPLSGDDINENYALQIGSKRFFPLSAENEKGDVIGHFIIRYPLPDDDSSVRFGFVIVDPSLRGKGYGKELLRLGIEYVRKNLKASRIDLGVFENNERARHCYEAAGFREYGTRECGMPIGTWNCTDMEIFLEKTLETERLILRRWNEDDAEDLFKYASDPDVGPICGWPAHQSIDESRDVIKNVFSGKEAYAVCLKEDGKAIGAIELKLNGHTDMTERDDECELGYWLGKPFWGQDIMPEAVREMLRHAFEDCGMEKVWIGYYEGNTKSKRVQEKCGFKYQWTTEGVDVPLMHEKRTGHVSMMTKEDWLLQENRNLHCKILVEKAGIGDIDALVKLRLDYLTEDNGPLDKNDAEIIRGSLPDYYQKHLNKDLTAYVIREGKTIVSCAFLLEIEKPMSPAFINGKTGTVLNVYTCPANRHRGYAKMIMETLLAEAKRLHLSVVELKSTEDGYPLYKLVGFTDDCSKYHLMKWKGDIE